MYGVLKVQSHHWSRWGWIREERLTTLDQGPLGYERLYWNEMYYNNTNIASKHCYNGTIHNRYSRTALPAVRMCDTIMHMITNSSSYEYDYQIQAVMNMITSRQFWKWYIYNVPCICAMCTLSVAVQFKCQVCVMCPSPVLLGWDWRGHPGGGRDQDTQSTGGAA